MTKTPWKPWHEVVDLLDELKTGELSLSMFAPDLYDVTMVRAKQLYQNPEKLFGRTSPTFSLGELVKDIVLRLAGKNDKAVRQLEPTVR
jgi:predicted AAA+ superfamily ATPase